MFRGEGNVHRAGDCSTWQSALHRCFYCWLYTAFLLPLASPAAGAAETTSRDELLRLVPHDVGLCLVLEDLRGHGTALANSPFVGQFRTSPLGATIRNAPETQKLTELDRFLQRSLELTATQLRDDILGDVLVLAYRPGPPGKTEEEEGLFLIRARDHKLLARLIERINTLQKESGDLMDLEERAYQGEKYYRRVERTGTNYYYLRGPVLAFAPREGILRQLIDLDRDAPKDAESPVARQFRLLGIGKSLAALWINPRAFDATLINTAAEQKAAAGTGGQTVARRSLSAYWKALEGVGFSMVLEKDLALSLAIRAKVQELPSAAQRFLHTASAPSEVWRHLPDSALLTLTGRLDIPALAEMLSEFLADDARKSLCAMVEGTVEAILGKDIVKGILASLGPDWGVCLVAPPAGDKAWIPQFIGALPVRTATVGVPADLAVWDALNALAMLAVFHHNRGQPGRLSLKSTLQDKTEVKYLVNDEQFPPGLRPAFALRGGYVVLASSPEAIGRFRAHFSGPSAPRTDEVPLLRLSLRGWYEYLMEQREPLLAYVAAEKHISKEEVGQRLDHLLLVLRLFDQVELIQHCGPGLLTLTLRVQTAKPLK